MINHMKSSAISGKLTRTICLAVAVGGALAAAAAADPDEPPVSRVKWICPDEAFPAGIGKDRFYRTAFEVRDGLVRAEARWWFDDHGTLFVDGRERGQTWSVAKPVDLTKVLSSAGRHVVAVCNRNLAGRGGVCFSLTLAYADGTTNRVHSTADWRCALKAPKDWSSVGFDDASWPRARVFDDATASPWAEKADMTALMPDEDRRALADYAASRAARLEKTMALLKGEPKPQCRVVYEKGRARLDIGGRMFEPILYNTSQSWHDSNRKLLRQAAYFRDASVHLYGLGVQTADVWRPDGSIDFAPAEAVMKSALSVDPEARFFFSINTVLPPRWWVDAHPDELVGYQKAAVNPDEQQCLKNCAAASAASAVWRRDIADFERRLVAHLEASPFASRIFAYRTDWGINHEWHYYGMRGYFADSGKAMKAAFRDWLRQRYGGDVTKLRAAWRKADVTFESAQVPPPEDRLKRSAGRLREPVLDRPTVDYERCHARMLRELLVHCDRAIKDACGGRALVGNYGGYYFGMAEIAEGWHLENDDVLDDACIDFQCSPQVYGDMSRRPGGVQYARCLLEGLRRRGKLSLQEADNSTTFSGSTYNHWSKDRKGDIALLARDFAQTLCWGCGFWYFDFGQGWYATDEFADYFRKILPIRSEPADCTSVSEVLVVGDYESVMFSHVDWPPPRGMQRWITDQVNELGGAGAPFDTASVRDLASGKLKDYKVYLFPNLYYVTPEKETLVNRLRAEGKRLAWIGPAGALGPDGKRTGAWAKPGEVVSDGPLSRVRLRELYRDWGVHVYNDDTNAAVYACASYVALHSADARRETIRLPVPARVYEVYPERRLVGSDIREFSFEAESPSTSIFRIER